MSSPGSLRRDGSTTVLSSGHLFVELLEQSSHSKQIVKRQEKAEECEWQRLAPIVAIGDQSECCHLQNQSEPETQPRASCLFRPPHRPWLLLFGYLVHKVECAVERCLCNARCVSLPESWPSFFLNLFIISPSMPNLNPPVRILQAQIWLSLLVFHLDSICPSDPFRLPFKI